MGLNDAQEMLDAALADALVYERTIAALKAKLAAIRHLIAASTVTVVDPKNGLAMPVEAVEVWELQQILDADE